MRDPKRIKRILNKLGKLWEEYPDMRLGQMLSWLSPLPDNFYLDDDILERAIERRLKTEKEK